MPLGRADRASYNQGRLTPRATRGPGGGRGPLLPDGEGPSRVGSATGRTATGLPPDRRGRRHFDRLVRPAGARIHAGRDRRAARLPPPDVGQAPGLIRETWLSSSPRRGHGPTSDGHENWGHPPRGGPGARTVTHERPGGGPSPCLSIARSSPSRTRWRGPGSSTRRASGTRPPGEPDGGRGSRRNSAGGRPGSGRNCWPSCSRSRWSCAGVRASARRPRITSPGSRDRRRRSRRPSAPRGRGTRRAPRPDPIPPPPRRRGRRPGPRPGRGRRRPGRPASAWTSATSSSWRRSRGAAWASSTRPASGASTASSR